MPKTDDNIHINHLNESIQRLNIIVDHVGLCENHMKALNMKSTFHTSFRVKHSILWKSLYRERFCGFLVNTWKNLIPLTYSELNSVSSIMALYIKQDDKV